MKTKKNKCFACKKEKTTDSWRKDVVDFISSGFRSRIEYAFKSGLTQYGSYSEENHSVQVENF